MCYRSPPLLKRMYEYTVIFSVYRHEYVSENPRLINVYDVVVSPILLIIIIFVVSRTLFIYNKENI